MRRLKMGRFSALRTARRRPSVPDASDAAYDADVLKPEEKASWKAAAGKAR